MATRCVNDTDGDGNCAACARNPQAPCRQTPGDRLRAALAKGMDSDCAYLHTEAQIRTLVDDYANDIAHQLARIQRSELDEVSRTSAGWIREDDMRGLINLIDPEVKLGEKPVVDYQADRRMRERTLVQRLAEEWSDELKTRFAPELRATDQWVDGWMSAADYIGEKPGPKP
jgi:hypothetical protein